MEIVVAYRILNNTGLTLKLLTTNKATHIRIHLSLDNLPFILFLPIRPIAPQTAICLTLQVEVVRVAIGV